jgi:hypothetical protein
MRLALFVLIFMAPGLSAQTPDLIVQRAISAHGGSDMLSKLKAVQISSKGKAIFGDQNVEGTRESKWALPDRAIWILEYPRLKLKTIVGINGLSGWQQVNTVAATEMSPPAYDTMTDEAHAYWLTNILPLTRKELVLTALADGTVDNQPTFAVKVTKSGKPDATVHFSKSTGVMVKVAYLGREAGIPEPKEILLSDHKTFEGLKLPTRIVDIKKGVAMGDWQVTNYKFVDKFDAATFKKPN